MILADVNALIYAFREGAPNHDRYRTWLFSILEGDEAFGVSELVLSGFVRIVTHPRVFTPPATLDEALAFVEPLRDHPHAVSIRPGDRHWPIFLGLCRSARCRGNLVPDAYLAALAIESGCEWITTDQGFARFKGLRWRHPLV